jgi:sugar-specific transcriptional regulator TrmB
MNNNMTYPKETLIQVGLTPIEADVYVLMTSGMCSAKNIIKHTSIKRATVYYVLANLEQRGLISKKNNHLDHEYIIESFDVLQGLAEAKKIEADKLVDGIKNTILSFSKKSDATEDAPTVAFYEGIETMKNIIFSTAYCKHKILKTIIPASSFFWNISDKFIREYVDRRIQNGVKTKSMWEKKIPDEAYRNQYKNISDIRMLPDHVTDSFSTSIFMYDNKVMYISSVENAYCIVITSAEHYNMMSALFEGLWVTSKEY